MFRIGNPLNNRHSGESRNPEHLGKDRLVTGQEFLDSGFRRNDGWQG